MISYLLLLVFVQFNFITSQDCNVLDYGAKGDGKADDTAAVQKTIDQCPAGRRILFPAPHNFLIFPISFKTSNSMLYIQEGATVIANDDIEKWPVSNNYVHFITASKLMNISIAGSGRIDGRGQKWWDRFTNGSLQFNRPNLVDYSGCSNCLFKDTTFFNSPSHTLEIFCSHTEMNNITILAPGDGHFNTDGVDLHGQYFWIHHSTISVGDDNVAIHNNDTLIENCYFGTGHGVSIGGGFLNNITVRNSVFNGTNQAARIKTRSGDVGLIQKVVYENLVIDRVNWPICIDMFYQNQPEFADCIIGTITGPTSQKIRDITFNNITASNVFKSVGIIACQPSSPCSDIILKDIHVAPPLPANPWICEHATGSDSDVSPHSCF